MTLFTVQDWNDFHEHNGEPLLVRDQTPYLGRLTKDRIKKLAEEGRHFRSYVRICSQLGVGVQIEDLGGELPPLKWPTDVEFDEDGRVVMEVDTSTHDVIDLISSEDKDPPEQSTTTVTLHRNPRRAIGKGVKGKEIGGYSIF